MLLIGALAPCGSYATADDESTPCGDALHETLTDHIHRNDLRRRLRSIIEGWEAELADKEKAFAVDFPDIEAKIAALDADSHDLYEVALASQAIHRGANVLGVTVTRFEDYSLAYQRIKNLKRYIPNYEELRKTIELRIAEGAPIHLLPEASAAYPDLAPNKPSVIFHVRRDDRLSTTYLATLVEIAEFLPDIGFFISYSPTLAEKAGIMHFPSIEVRRSSRFVRKVELHPTAPGTTEAFVRFLEEEAHSPAGF